MSISDKIEYIDIAESKELLPYFSQIALLFMECFGKPLDRQLWEWAYQLNPSGSPLVSLALCDGVIVGHYAAIPIPLENDNNKITGFLSMTTMVSSSFRRYRLFTILATRVNNTIESLGKPAVIFGFPNDKSAPGFKKRLGWVISEKYKVVKVNEACQQKCANLLSTSLSKSAYSLLLETDELINWRTNKPSQEWDINNGIGLKKFDGGCDLMYLKEPSLFSRIELKGEMNAVLPVGDSPEFTLAFAYRFGYRTFGFPNDHEPDFFVQMSMSDVF